MSDAPRIAAVLLAHATDDAEQLQAMVHVVRALGAHPVVVTLAQGAAAPAEVRVVRIEARAAWITAVRTGMAQLTNTPVQFALLWTGSAAVPGIARLQSLVAGIPAARSALVAMDGDDLDTGPVLIARTAWLELMTVGEAGMTALAARHPVHRVPDYGRDSDTLGTPRARPDIT